jgi:hypothetical protein
MTPCLYVYRVTTSILSVLFDLLRTLSVLYDQWPCGNYLYCMTSCQLYVLYNHVFFCNLYWMTQCLLGVLYYPVPMTGCLLFVLYDPVPIICTVWPRAYYLYCMTGPGERQLSAGTAVAEIWPIAVPTQSVTSQEKAKLIKYLMFINLLNNQNTWFCR